MNKFSIIIPARMDSTRLNRKMVQLIGDTPLIILTAKQAQKSMAQKVVVATDHNEIFDLCQKNKIDVVMTSSNHQSGTERIFETINYLKLSDDEIILNIQGDEPFVPQKLINDLATFMQGKEMATIAHPIFTPDEIFNPSIVKVVLDHQANALYFSRAAIPFYRDGFKPNQTSLPKELNLLRHIGIYGYKASFIRKYIELTPSAIEKTEALEQLRAIYYGYKIAVLISDFIPEGGIDTLEDLERARQKFATGQLNLN